jgi:DNA-binding transcriptional LysR family regulator
VAEKVKRKLQASHCFSFSLCQRQDSNAFDFFFLKELTPMQTSYQMFLLAVEEMNFTKAAKKAHMTQQSLSEHIRNLEKELGIPLFVRRPRLVLTEAGKAFYDTLRAMEQLETGCKAHLQEMAGGREGHLRFGTNAARSRILLPDLFSSYHQKFPYVTVNVKLGDMMNLARMMRNRELDVFLGIDGDDDALLTRISVGHEEIYLVASNQYLQQVYQGQSRWRPYKPGERISLRDFCRFSLIGNESVSTVSRLVERKLELEGIACHQIFSISDYETQFGLCSRGLGVTFCAKMMVESLLAYNRLHPDQEPLIPLRAAEVPECVRTDFYCPKGLYTPLYLTAFIEQAKDMMLTRYQAIDRYLANKAPGKNAG